MIVKNCDGQIPECGPLTDEDKALLAQADALYASTREDMGKQLIHRALASIIAVVSETDRYFAGQQPWALKKTDPARMGTVLYVTAEVVRQIAILLQPFVPDSADKLLDRVAAPADKRDFAALGEAGRLVPGTPLEAPTPVFPRYVAPEA
jgi:methionyl-tRNA synthetase